MSPLIFSVLLVVWSVNVRQSQRVSPQTHILFFMLHSKKVLGRCHKSGNGNNQERRRTTPRDNRGFNRIYCQSKSIEMSLPVIYVSLPLNNSVINPPQLSSVCQNSSMTSPNSSRDNKCLDSNQINSKKNELSSPVIPKLSPWNDPFINPTQLSLLRQQ